jgi:hypothetical protein
MTMGQLLDALVGSCVCGQDDCPGPLDYDWHVRRYQQTHSRRKGKP